MHNKSTNRLILLLGEAMILASFLAQFFSGGKLNIFVSFAGGGGDSFFHYYTCNTLRSIFPSNFGGGDNENLFSSINSHKISNLE